VTSNHDDTRQRIESEAIEGTSTPRHATYSPRYPGSCGHQATRSSAVAKASHGNSGWPAACRASGREARASREERRRGGSHFGRPQIRTRPVPGSRDS